MGKLYTEFNNPINNILFIEVQNREEGGFWRAVLGMSYRDTGSCGGKNMGVRLVNHL